MMTRYYLFRHYDGWTACMKTDGNAEFENVPIPTAPTDH